MEYIQTVLVQIEASKIEEALRPGGLLAELDDHRSYLERQPGYYDMRVTRSINPQGNVLLVVETRWKDDSSLVEYETREPNVASIVGGHQALIVADSLQVLDMESLRAEAAPETPAEEAGRRLAMPLLVPMAALAFALLVIYGLSRVYLEVPNDVATGLAAGIALGVLGAAWIIAANPQIQAGHIVSVFVVAAAVLAGGAIYAVIQEDDGEAEAETPEATASPSAGETPEAPPAGDFFEVAIVPVLSFDQTEMTLPAETEITVSADNQETAVPHNWAMYESREIAESQGSSAAIAFTEICSAPCVEEVTFTTPTAGEYFFRCDVHPAQMVGTVTVQ